MIKLRGHTLGVERSFVPLSYAPQLTDRGGTASMTVGPREEEIALGSWLLDNHPPAAGTVWRVRSTETDRNTGVITYGLEHIIQVLEDQILPGEYAPGDIRAGASQVSARRAIEFALGFQDIWQLGEVDFDLVAPFNFNRDTILDVLDTVTEALDNAVWEFDLSEMPFTLNVRHADTEAACEMRKGRNLTKLTIRTDRARMYTRIYPIGKNDLELPEKYISQNEEIWGRVDHTQTDQSIENVNGLRIWGNGLLRKHCEPGLTVTGAGLEISEATGEPLDRLRINRVCRVPDPETGNPITARIVKIQWRNKIREPENVTVTLSNDEEDVARIVNQIKKGGGGGGRADAKNAKEDHAWFVDTDEHVAMVAEAIIGHDDAGVDWSRVATVIVDGNGIHNRVTAAEGEIVVQQAQIDINENRILQEIIDRSAEDLTLSARITTTADEISAEVARASAAENTLSGRITVNAGKVALVVEEVAGENVVKAASIVAAINDSGSEISMNADKITMGVSQEDLDTWAAGAEGLIAARATIGQLNAVSARVQTIEADYVVADDISANKIRALVDGGTFSSLATTSLVVGGISYAPNGVCKSVTATNNNGQITFTQNWMSGASTPIITFSPAASATLSGSWSGATYTAIAADASGTEIARAATTIAFHWNGNNNLEVISGSDLLLTESFTFEAHTGISSAGGLTTINTFDQDHKAYGLVIAGSLGVLRRFQVDASGEYNAGYSDGNNAGAAAGGTAAGLTINETAHTVERAVSSSTKSLGISARLASATYNATTHQYDLTIYGRAGTTDMGSITPSTGTEAYDAGNTAGYITGYNAGTAAGGTAAGLTINSTANTVERAVSSTTKSLAISARLSSATYNTTTHKYDLTIYGRAGTTDMGSITPSTGTEAYDAGVDDGYADGYDDGWSGYYNSSKWQRPRTANGGVCATPNTTPDGAMRTWFTITASATLTYNSTTHKYTAVGKAYDGSAEVAASSGTTSGTEAYEAGYAAGWNKGWDDAVSKITRNGRYIYGPSSTTRGGQATWYIIKVIQGQINSSRVTSSLYALSASASAYINDISVQTDTTSKNLTV